MSNNKQDLVNVISRGQLVEGFEATRVTRKLQQQFNINEKQAACLLKAGVILKKNVAAKSANALCQNLLRLGLVTGIRPVSPVSGQSSQAVSTKKPPANTPINKTRLDKIFAEDIPRAPVTIGYRIGLVAVAMLSLIAPTLYFGFMASLLVGLYYHFSNLPHWLDAVSGGTVKILVIVLPPFVICVLTLFMAKPLFTRIKRWHGFQLQRQQAPGLFAVVETLCHRIKVPVPSSINVDNRVNASAGSAHGLMALLRGQLVLTVGLPLAAGMSARQFVGVLAHEFGHFAQPSAMFAYYLINSVNHWFADRAFYADPWDERLANWEDNTENIGTAWIAVKFAQWGISITRHLFKLLYMLNLRVTSYMSRQMEYDADRYEALVSGSDSFRTNALQLRILSEAEGIVDHSNQLAWNQNKLLKNIPAAIAKQSLELDQEDLQQIESGMAEQDSDWWDSHPPDNDRVKHAQSYEYQAIFNVEFQAQELFADFPTLCSAVTLYNYRADGLEQAEKYIVDNEKVLEVKETQEKTNAALTRYFNDTFSRRPMKLAKASDDKLAVLNLQATIDWLRQNLVKYRENQHLFSAVSKRYQDMMLGQCYLDAGIEFEATEFYLNELDSASVEQSATAELSRLQVIRAELEQVDAMFFQRIFLAIKTMKMDKQKKCVGLLKVLQAISQLNDPWSRLQRSVYVLECLLSYDEQQTLPELKTGLAQQIKFCAQDLGVVLRSTNRIPDLVDASQGSKVSNFILSWTGTIPSKLSELTTWQIVDVCTKASNALHYQYTWLFGELATQCEAQEQAMGLQGIKLVTMPSSNTKT